MKNKSKYIIIASLCIIVLLTIGFVSNFIYGHRVPTDMLFNTNVNTEGNMAYISADIESSSLAFAGYDAELDGAILLISPRYSLVSSFNRSGKLEIEYDTEWIALDKIFLVGTTANDKKQIWPSKGDSLYAKQQKAIASSLEFIGNSSLAARGHINTDIIKIENATDKTWEAVMYKGKQVEQKSIDLSDWVITIGDTSYFDFAIIVSDSYTSEVIGYIPID